MENFYDKCQNKIKEIINEENNKPIDLVDKQIKAFTIYKTFIKEILPIIINRYINYELKTDILSSDTKDNFNIKEEYMQFNLSIVSTSNESFKYLYNKRDYKNYLIINKELFSLLLDYIKRMVSRNKIEMKEKYQNKTDYDLENYDKEYYENYYSLDLYFSLPVKDLIYCYYNELQTVELMEEEINILKEENNKLR